MNDFKATLCVSHANEMNLLGNNRYQQTGSMASRVEWNAAKIKNGILKHCAENPIAADTELTNIASNMTVSPIAERDIVERGNKKEKSSRYLL